MEYYFIHCNDVELSLFTPMKVDDDTIVDLLEIFKDEVQLILAKSSLCSKLKLMKP